MSFAACMGEKNGEELERKTASPSVSLSSLWKLRFFRSLTSDELLFLMTLLGHLEFFCLSSWVVKHKVLPSSDPTAGVHTAVES